MMKIDGFSHFPHETLDFLTALQANNDRDWFAENKLVYERAVKQPAEDFCRAMTPQLDEMTGLRHRSKIFRVHRDVRFSRDKTPYNAHLHMSFMPVTEGLLKPGWFFGLEPDRLVAGTGVFDIGQARLDAFRTRIAGDDGGDLAALLQDLSGNGARLSEPELKRVPQPYPADHPHGQLLRHKSLSGWEDFAAPRLACENGFAEKCLAAFVRLKPLFDWLAAGRD